jgi:isochorismate synthase
MADEPPFVLCAPDEVLVGEGIAKTYVQVTAASADLRSGIVPIVMGALPFDLETPVALLAPRSVWRGASVPVWPIAPLPAVHIAAEVPSREDHRARIRRARVHLNEAGSPLRKVVLARALQLAADAPVDARAVLCRLVAADPAAYGYLVDLTPAGAGFRGAALVGASPELLVARKGDRVICQPFAGSAPRSTDPDLDQATGAALARSAKDRHEHQLVIDAMRAALRPLCDQLVIPASPQLSRTATLWHLSTPISGRLRESSTTAIDLVLALHPTPAVGGAPTKEACELIAELEGNRGFYAGAVGWCDARGDGRWAVSIRGAQLAADRRSALAHAGGGIVAESNPDDEVDETTTKFGTILTALGVER